MHLYSLYIVIRTCGQLIAFVFKVMQYCGGCFLYIHVYTLLVHKGYKSTCRNLSLLLLLHSGKAVLGSKMPINVKSPLLSSTAIGNPQSSFPYCPPCFSKRYRTTCVTTKSSLFLLFAVAIISVTRFAFYVCIYEWIAIDGALSISTTVYYLMEDIPTGISFLIFPILGLVGELWCKRYKMLLLGSLLVAMSVTIACASSIFCSQFGIGKLVSGIPLFLSQILLISGMGAFQTNALQYGVDQLDFPSSEVLSSFVYWYYWASYAFYSLAIMLPLLTNAFYFILYCVLGVLWSSLLLVAIYCCCKNPHLRINHGNKVNPVKLIYKVLLFAKRNKYPLFRSAFTYNEMPSRLDLAKQRYGGPFTTEEVEEVKSFWRILLVLTSLMGFQLLDEDVPTFNLIMTFFQDEFTAIEMFIVTAFRYLVVAVVIPVYQFVVRPYFHRHIPKMLTKMGIGLLITFFSLLVITAYHRLIFEAMSQMNMTTTVQLCNNTGCHTIWENCSSIINVCNISLHPESKQDNLPQCADGNCETKHNYSLKANSPRFPSLFWIMIPQALNAFAHMLIFLSALEFILAQAPRTMQGFLIGLWHAMLSVELWHIMVGYISCVSFHWPYYASKSLLLLLSFFVFVIVARRYKYRQMNEETEINVRQEVEDVFERNFDREAAYEQRLL